MKLCRDKKLFYRIIESASNYYKIDSFLIEKDYYVTLVLKEIINKNPKVVFKGGTSLSKCYKMIKRFSEDIDLTLEKEFQTVGNKKQLKETITSSIESLDLELINFDNIRSRRDYNCYIINYPINYDNIGIKPQLIIETTFITNPFPVEERQATSIIYDYLIQINRNDLVLKYELEPFLVKVQSFERTFVDKVFAICDYVIDDKIDGHSRHLYDIHCLLKHITLDEQFKNLINEIREERKHSDKCYSARDGFDINKALIEIIDNKIYYQDFKNTTLKMLYEKITYDEVIASLSKIIASNIFV